MTPDALFTALAHPLRVRLLSLLLAEKELCVCDLGAIVGAPQPTISRHLAMLRRAGLVEVRTEGRWKHYALAAPTTRLHRLLLRALDRCVDEGPDLVADRARLEGHAIALRCGPATGDVRRASRRRRGR